jgi:UDP-N-acetylglucosamine 2-epimerase (non-hydrolysing)
MRVISIVGARPQFIKVAPIAWKSDGLCEHLIIHTGQHYDPQLSENFFSELGIPIPFKNLYSGSGSHAAQTAKIIVGVEDLLLELKPDWVLVYGDTNSTIAATLAATKLGIKVGHIEAGLRSYNRVMPEELNRIGTDHLSDLLFAPTKEALSNLDKEGLSQKSVIVGDVMVETLSHIKTQIVNANVSNVEKVFATIHRAENTDHRSRLSLIIQRLSLSPIPVFLYAHPRLLRRAEEFGISLNVGSINLREPLSYFETVKGILESAGVITDSGGLQKEAYLLERPCITVRNETEWVETLEGSWNYLDPSLEMVDKRWWEIKRPPIQPYVFGDGWASTRILEALSAHTLR